MEKKMENEMETGIIKVLFELYFICFVFCRPPCWGPGMSCLNAGVEPTHLGVEG